MEFLGAQVGVDKDSVTEIVGELSQQRIVAKAHRSITILNHEELSAACCECFAVCKDATEQYMAGLTALASANGRA
jgi:hypothetical protein